MVRLLSFAVALALTATLAGAFSPVLSKAGKTVQRTVESPLFRCPAPTSTAMNDMLKQTELPEKLYFEKDKEMPKVLGGIQIGLRKLVVVTGASSGLGLNCAATLAKTGRYFVVMACRDVEKGKASKSEVVLHLFLPCVRILANRLSLLS